MIIIFCTFFDASKSTKVLDNDETFRYHRKTRRYKRVHEKAKRPNVALIDRPSGILNNTNARNISRYAGNGSLGLINVQNKGKYSSKNDSSKHVDKVLEKIHDVNFRNSASSLREKGPKNYLNGNSFIRPNNISSSSKTVLSNAENPNIVYNDSKSKGDWLEPTKHYKDMQIRSRQLTPASSEAGPKGWHTMTTNPPLPSKSSGVPMEATNLPKHDQKLLRSKKFNNMQKDQETHNMQIHRKLRQAILGQNSKYFHKKLKQNDKIHHVKQEDIFAIKLKRLISDVKSLVKVSRDKTMISSLMRELYKNTVKRVRGQKHGKHRGKGQSSKWHRSKSHHNRRHNSKHYESKRQNSKGHEVDNLYEGQEVSNKMEHLSPRKPKPASKQSNNVKRFRSMYSVLAANETFSKQELLKYIIAQNILRSGWPFLPQQRNKTEIYKIIDLLRSRKEAMNSSDLDNSARMRNTTTSAYSVSVSHTHKNSIMPQDTSKELQNASKSILNRTISHVVLPSYEIVPNKLERTPHLPPKNASFYVNFSNETESTGIPNLPPMSTKNSLHLSPSKEKTLDDFRKSFIDMANTSTPILNVTRLRGEKMYTNFATPQGYHASLNFSQSYVMFNRSNGQSYGVLSSVTVNMNASLSLNLNSETLVHPIKMAYSTPPGKDTDEILISDLIAAYDLLLKDKHLYSPLSNKDTENSADSKEKVGTVSWRLQPKHRPIASYIPDVVVSKTSQPSTTIFSHSAAKFLENRFLLVDEESSLVDSGLRTADKSITDEDTIHRKKIHKTSIEEDKEFLLPQKVNKLADLKTPSSSQRSLIMSGSCSKASVSGTPKATVRAEALHAKSLVDNQENNDIEIVNDTLGNSIMAGQNQSEKNESGVINSKLEGR